MIKDNGFTLCKAQNPINIWVEGSIVHMHARYLETLKLWLEEALKEVQQKMEDLE